MQIMKNHRHNTYGSLFLSQMHVKFPDINTVYWNSNCRHEAKYYLQTNEFMHVDTFMAVWSTLVMPF